jgi:hypothetical protein
MMRPLIVGEFSTAMYADPVGFLRFSMAFPSCPVTVCPRAVDMTQVSASKAEHIECVDRPMANVLMIVFARAVRS